MGNKPPVWAAKDGHGRVVEMLLRPNNVTPDKVGDNSQTPLHWATKDGNKAAVALPPP